MNAIPHTPDAPLADRLEAAARSAREAEAARDAAAAERAAAVDPAIASAAAVLGVPVHEVANVAETDAGFAITTFDGGRYVLVPEDRPDADGKTGLMFLEAPTPGYAGGVGPRFPVYASRGDAA